MTTLDHAIDPSIDRSSGPRSGQTLDHSIARDLAAVAADSRRAWRTADEAIALLAVRREKARVPRPEVLTLAALTQMFARRVAWIAAAAAGVFVIALVLAMGMRMGWNTQGPDGETVYVELITDLALIPALGWVLVPMLAAYALARSVATRWLAAGLTRAAAPDEMARRLLRKVDGWSTGARIVAGTWVALLFGVMLVAFHARWNTWSYDFVYGTARHDELGPLGLALAALVPVIGVLSHASTREARWLSTLATRRAIALGVLAIALAIIAAQTDSPWRLDQAPALALQIAGTFAASFGVLLVVTAFVLRRRVHDLRLVEDCPRATTPHAVTLLALQQTFVRRGAWAGAGVMAVSAVLLLLALLHGHFDYRTVGFVSMQPAPHYVIYARWVEYNQVSDLLSAAGSTWICVAALVIAGHVLGARVAERSFARWLGTSGEAAALARGHALVARLAGAAPVALAAGLAAVTTMFAASATVFHHDLHQALLARVLYPQTGGRTLDQVALATLLVVVLAIALVRARPASRWRCVLRSPIAPSVGGLLLLWAGMAGSRVQLFAANLLPSRAPNTAWSYIAPELPLLRPALILAVTLGAFLVFTWIGLRVTASACAADRRSGA